MENVLQIILILLLLSNFLILASSNYYFIIRFVSAQGLMLAGMLLLNALLNGSIGMKELGLVFVIILIKGIILPYILEHTRKKITVGQLIVPRIGYRLSVFVGLCFFLFSLWVESRLYLVRDIFFPLLLPIAMTTLFCGFLLIVGRMKALTQVIGYLVAENGIFMIGLPLMLGHSSWFEFAIMLDLLVAVFVMGIALTHINQTFESIELDKFSNLRD